VFAFPWEGAILVGTTDVDHKAPIDQEPAISLEEATYLLEAVQAVFPEQEICSKDVLATFSGIRPVINTGKNDPSKESREHVLWQENGLLTVTGGKLTTFRLMAQDALKRIKIRPADNAFDANHRILAEPSIDLNHLAGLPPAIRLRLLGRLGMQAVDLLEAARSGEKDQIANTASLWAELRWAARAEGVVHLDDLLLRRVRLGILLPRGGMDCIERIRAIVQDELQWDDFRWANEANAYANLWKRCYHLSPDW
jgi:glycerol-3-phosphate dehydrogenase